MARCRERGAAPLRKMIRPPRWQGLSYADTQSAPTTSSCLLSRCQGGARQTVPGQWDRGCLKQITPCPGNARQFACTIAPGRDHPVARFPGLAAGVRGVEGRVAPRFLAQYSTGMPATRPGTLGVTRCAPCRAGQPANHRTHWPVRTGLPPAKERKGEPSGQRPRGRVPRAAGCAARPPPG